MKHESRAQKNGHKSYFISLSIFSDPSSSSSLFPFSFFFSSLLFPPSSEKTLLSLPFTSATEQWSDHCLFYSLTHITNNPSSKISFTFFCSNHFLFYFLSLFSFFYLFFSTRFPVVLLFISCILSLYPDYLFISCSLQRINIMILVKELETTFSFHQKMILREKGSKNQENGREGESIFPFLQFIHHGLGKKEVDPIRKK